MQAPTFFNAENRRDAESAEREKQASQDEQRRRMQAPTFFNAENRRDAESAEKKKQASQDEQRRRMQAPLIFNAENRRDAESAEREKAGFAGEIDMIRYQDEDLTGSTIAAAIDVHKTLGPGLLNLFMLTA